MRRVRGSVGRNNAGKENGIDEGGRSALRRRCHIARTACLLDVTPRLEVVGFPDVETLDTYDLRDISTIDLGYSC